MSDEEYNSDSSIASDYGLLKKALPFTVPENFDPTKVPETAEEFLQYAAYERSKLKPWVTAKIDKSKLIPAVCQVFDEEVLNNSVSSEFLPSQEWQQEKLQEFIEFHEFIQSKVKSTGKDCLEPKNFLNTILNQTPTYSELYKYSQADKIKVLEMINQYLSMLEKGTCFDFNVGCWIYAMLSLLEMPLFSDDCHVVRTLAKICIDLRSNYKETVKEKYVPLNLFICIVSKFFRQLDLSDP